MSEKANPFFSVTNPSVSGVPHLITALDSELLQAITQINGAKMGVWNIPAPYDEENRYEPYRENARFSDWALPYNQNQLLNNEILEPNTIITDSGADEAALTAVSEDFTPDEEGEGHSGFQDISDFPGLLKKTGWALVPVGNRLGYALFAASVARKDYVELLKQWCHRHGRVYYTIAAGSEGLQMKAAPAPENSRAQVIHQHGQQFLQKMAHLGVPPEDVQKHFSDLIAVWVEQSEKPA
jgi:hypothetical protein